MSRLGDQIRQERTKQGLSAKALAKKCGMSESYITEVESGTRILNDASAERILKVLGAAAAHNESFYEPETLRAAPKPAAPAQPSSAPAVSPNDAWKAAMSSIVRAVPILDIADKQVGNRSLPVEEGKIQGSAADKVFYLKVPDNALADWRICAGDLVLVLPEKEQQFGPLLYVTVQQSRMLCKLFKIQGNKVALQTPEGMQAAKVVKREEVHVLGRCVRLEVDL